MFPTYFHTAAFAGAKTDSTLNENAPAVSDDALTTSGNSRYIAPADISIFAATIMNDTITRARVTAPSLRNEGLPEIYPVTVSNVPAASVAVAEWERETPRVKMNEEFGVESSNGASTVDEVHCLVWFREVVAPLPAGKRMTIFATSTITAVKNAWVSGALTLDQTLPPGRYAVIGMAVQGATSFGARLIFPKSTSYRPGCPVHPTYGQFESRHFFRNGRQGVWGIFDQLAQPRIEVIGNAAGSTVYSAVLDLIQLGA